MKKKRKLIEGIDFKNHLCSVKSRHDYVLKRIADLEDARKLNKETGLCWEQIKLHHELEFLSKNL